jgi:single stranded DNA-binding protein
MNKALLIGRVASKLDLRKTETGKSRCSFLLAINEWVDKKQYTTFLQVVAWENVAQKISDSVNKGDKIYVEGRIRARVYQKHNIHEIVVETFTCVTSEVNKSIEDEDCKELANVDAVFETDEL